MIDITKYEVVKTYKTKFDVGDRVYLREDMYPVSDVNPIGTCGTITYIDWHVGLVSVAWPLGYYNMYRHKDLMSEEEYLDKNGCLPVTEVNISGPVMDTFKAPTVKKEPEGYVPKVVFKYLNGEPYTIKGEYVSDIYWEMEYPTVCIRGGSLDYNLVVDDDLLCVEQWEEHSMKAWFNPKYKKSAKLDVMTAKQRCKANNVGTGSAVGNTLKAMFPGSMHCTNIKGYIYPPTKGDLCGCYKVTPEQSERLQKLCFSVGIDWYAKNGTVSNVASNYLYISDYILHDESYYNTELELRDVEEVLQKYGA